MSDAEAFVAELVAEGFAEAGGDPSRAGAEVEKKLKFKVRPTRPSPLQAKRCLR